jgi:hypothetical protein
MVITLERGKCKCEILNVKSKKEQLKRLLVPIRPAV